ncbi:hypothetical protein [Okibacterium endophyticum]
MTTLDEATGPRNDTPAGRGLLFRTITKDLPLERLITRTERLHLFGMPLSAEPATS